MRVNTLIEGAVVIFIGFTILPAIIPILDYLDTDVVQGLPGLTTFEAAVMGFFPIALFMAILLGAVMVVLRVRGKKSGE